MKNKLGLSETDPQSKSSTDGYSRSDSSQTATGYIAGRDVYVSASNINVNGLIQSGYKTYAATVTEAQLTTAKTRPASRAVVVQNRTMYKVNDGGAKWNSTDKAFDYVPQVYWDPATNKLVVEDIDTAGGKVYLTGKIASTGDGRILAADGAAEISVINQTNLDMNVGNVLNNQREGVITIADTAKNTWTEYKRGQTRTIENYSSYLKDHAGDSDIYAGAVKTDNNLNIGSSLDYAVLGNQAYTWVNGNSVDTTRTYQHYERRGMWGLVQTADESTLQGWSKNSTPIDKTEGAKLGLPEGAVITTSENVPASGKLHLDGHTTLLNEKIFGQEHWVETSGFLGWFKHIYDRWKVGTSAIQLYNYSLNASQKLTIGLLGAEVGKIDIKSTNASGGSINLTGNVANSHNQATLTVSSAAGGITQFDNTTLKSEIVNLVAQNDIKNIHLVSLGTATKDANGNVTAVNDNIQLSAVSTNKGDIDITAVGGILANRSLPGNVEIVELKSKDGSNAFSKSAALGDVTLNAAGNITQSGSGITVEGRGITLTSKEGGIGTEAQAINMAGSDLIYSTDRYGAQVNASAHGDIYLTESAAGGDMRVGKIESKTGDVMLNVEDGGFIDGLPGDDKSGSTDSVDERVHRWIDAGLIDGEKDAQGNYTYKGAYIEGLEKARDDYAANVTAAYDPTKGGKTQTDWTKEYTEQKTAYESYLDNKATNDALSQAERKALEEKGDAGYAAYKHYSASDKQTYLASKAKYDKMSAEELQALETNNDADYAAYKYYAANGRYEKADDYLKQTTAAYKYAQYADANAYLAADATYKDLAAKAAPENRKFEWTKDMMLYAVSDKLVNPNSGSSAQTERAANVLGRNITLNSTKGAVGDVSDTSITISVDDLTGDNRIENMKKLMSMEASDVKAKRDANGNLTEFVITPNMPLGVKASGTLNVQAGGNVSVAGRKDENGEHSALKVGSVDATKNGATGDVRLHSELGIYNDLADANGTNVTGKNLILTGGKESIGTSDKPLTISLSGDMTETRADKNVFIKNMKDSDYLRLGAMYANDIISLNSDKGFLMSNANGEIAQSYINAGKKLEFNTNAESGIVGGIVDDKDLSIRILNDRAPVNITAKSAHIKGVNNTDVRNGTLVLGTVNTKEEFVAASEGSLTVGREEEKNKAAVAGSVNAGGDVTLTAAENLTLDGAVTAVDSQSAKKDLTLTATNGSITQTDKGAITADKVKTFNGKSLLLENAANKFDSITVDGTPTGAAEKPDIAGDVRIKDNADALTVKIKRDVTGDISVTNLRENGSLTNEGNLAAAGNIALSAQGTLSQAENTIFTAGKDVKLTSAAADIKQAENAGIEATKVTTTSAKTVDLQGTGNKFKSIAVQASQADAPITGDVLVKTATDDLNLFVQPTVAGNIAVENRDANGSIEVLSALQARDDDDTTVLKGNISLTAGADVNIRRDITTGQEMPAPENTFTVANILADKYKYNSLTVKAGGVIQETEGVKIDAPVVDTQSGKGVSLESSKNKFAIFLADGKDGGDEINGSVKAITNYEGTYVAGTRVDSIKGDADFTNLADPGSVRFLADSTDSTDLKGLSVLGGNNAQTAPGSLRLAAGKDVELLGHVYAKNDIVLASLGEGSVYGLGKGMEAGNDVFMLAKDAVYYIGTVKAGNSIDVEVWKAASANGGSGIHIGSIPAIAGNSAEGVTSLEAGKDMSFIVKGNGNIDLDGKLAANAGAVTATVSGQGDIVIGQKDEANEETITAKGDVTVSTGQGDIAIVKGIKSQEESIKLETGKGDITVGRDNVSEEESLVAKKNVSIGTETGTITIKGHTTTETGDISMKAGKDEYKEGAENGNFIIKDDGLIKSGGGINLYGRNGDVYITDKLSAEKGLTATVREQGSVIFGTDVDVNKDVNITTETGTIAVGHTVNSKEGSVNLQTGTGAVLIGKDITAGDAVTISSHEGDIVVGAASKGDDGDVLAKKGNVSIKTDKGNIDVVKTVTVQEGSLDIASGQGDILIGNNGPDVKTVTAKQDLSLAAKDGKVVVYGKTSTEVGDISISAHKQVYTPGENNQSFIIDQNGKLEAGGAIHLDVGNGDLHVSDRIQTKKDLVAELEEKGSIYFDTDLNVDGEVRVKTVDGDINIGHEVLAAKDVSMTSEKGNINVGSAIKSAQGSVDVQVGTGNVTIGDNGPDVETVTAQEGIKVDVNLGKIMIYGKTSTKNGDIAMSAGDSQYKPGEQNIIIGLNGMVDSGRDVRLDGRNGDLHVTDAIRLKRNLEATVHNGGGVFFEKKATIPGYVSLAGNFIYADDITADNHGSLFHFTAQGAVPQKLISEDFYVGSLHSKGGTQMPGLWTNRGYLHVAEGNLAVDDVLSVDKLYLDNKHTNLAVYGRTPTRDGEQLAYWNNLGLAYSKERSFQLYQDGMLGTHGAILIDAGKNYRKLYGDNLSVVDMMRERVTNAHGKYTFDSALLTEPARTLREQVFLDKAPVETDFRQKNASDQEIVIE